MAALKFFGLSEKKGMVQNVLLTMELVLLSTGLISTFFMLKKATSPYYLFDMVLVNLSEILNSLKSFLSSPLYILLFINSVVILILTFSKFHQPIKKFLNNFFLDEKDAGDDIQIQPQAHHEIKEDITPNRTNSAIAMDTVMSFFNPYNSHPPVLEDIQDDMPCSSVKDTKIDSAQTRTATTSKIDSAQTRTATTSKIDSAQTRTRTTTLPQSQTSRGRLKSKSARYSSQTSHNFPDISHLTKAREIVSPRSSNPPHETTTRTNYQENIEEVELEDDSLEATWKAITRQKELRKSFTFHDDLSVSRIGGLRGDISVSTEESNKSFDDFIKKINRERLMQRQESDQRAINNHMLNRAR